jgi:hypothetical protein
VPNNVTAILQGYVRANVKEGASLMTDTAGGYYGLGAHYKHGTVNHSFEYVNGRPHTNSIEAFWSLFKRQYHGTHHWISEKHLDSYLDEACYRANRRKMGEGKRVNDLLTQVEGRLTYKALIA